MKVRHMKFAVRMEINDPFDNMGDLILKDFYNNGWSNWTGILYNNENQLELFDTKEYQKYDRFGRVIK
tara:strand:+ start:222 stop:425 length:204 start_codon:yes stop_codon:yes gene_type:complete